MPDPVSDFTLYKQGFYKQHIWPRWIDSLWAGKPRVLFIPGIMGSELYDYSRKDEKTVWVDLGLRWDVDNLEVERLTPRGLVDVQDQYIVAHRTVQVPFAKDYYSTFLGAIPSGLFCYDWRESIPIEARRLTEFLRTAVEGSTSNDTFSIVTHSMGGLVTLTALMGTTEFDNIIERVIFCAPPFYGALKPVQVVESGTGAPGDFLIRNSTLMRSSATMPGLFQLAPAPRDVYPTSLPDLPISLRYPIEGDINLHTPGAWNNPNHVGHLRRDILMFAEKYHHKNASRLDRFLERFGDRIHVVAGLNGKNTYTSATRENGHWSLHHGGKPADGMRSNGDGTVLFQSSLLQGMDVNRCWAFAPDERKNWHAGIMDRKPVIKGVKKLLADETPSTLVKYPDFIHTVDFSTEKVEVPAPKAHERLDFVERARARSVVPFRRWRNRKLMPKYLNASDDSVFHATREAAFRVLEGADLEAEEERLGVPEGFLGEFLERMYLPAL